MTATPHVTPPELVRLEPDQYGQKHPVENEKIIAQGLALLEEEIAKLPEEKKEGIRQAEERYPELAKSDEHKLMFLRCEQFNADLAAKRFAKYWNKRIELFGDKAFEPLTLDKALRDDEAALSNGFIRLMPTKDNTGRPIIWIDPSFLDDTKYTRESMARALIYIAHAALEEESAQQKGVIFMCYNGNNPKFEQIDRQLITLLAGALTGVMPLRVSALYILHTPFLFNVLANVLMFFLGEKLQKRIRILPNKVKEIVERLEASGIELDILPTELNGSITLDQEQWLEERRMAGK
mmetsp:Transcript_3928/g.5295  ORF Transcript_3928/g.5295 Transcript_3928/m.5295 type:complete len:294 (-) Transcript_3928:389-1270(-)|eukprot:CAMPEP_0185729326 /NCGR_PEP_ID=MMETSP1171-20130828/5096_1 /TAXON_ID=374046 /ORGANISM="Helicotheca tamensis, Strain CCMP826" /LENGTH=293 /DNA_ID=CAMNT_0028398133 /DNA_START=28 /DNA_END=909 /DNA_ORIENTATION=-